MKRPYLLGFIRNCIELPREICLPTELTTLGEHGVIWCKSPTEIFTTKQDFLSAMLQWFEQIHDLELTVLPIQSGLSVPDEGCLVDLLRTYKEELDLCFEKVEGCSEYCLTIVQTKQEPAHVSYSSLREKVQSGKEYLDRMRAWHQLIEKEIQQLREVVAHFCLRLTPWIKDYWSEMPQNGGTGMNMGFLVPNIFKQEFMSELKTILDEVHFTDEWTGPWPPFHFSSFKLKPESGLTYESLNWEKRSVI